MGFDWQSFATGFMQETVDILDERRAEAKEFEQQQRASAERNAATISRRRAIADQVRGYANYLTSNGVSDAQIQAVIASGPQAISSLTERVQAAVQANGGRPLSSSDVSTLITMPAGFTPLDMDRNEYIDTTYGLGRPQQTQSGDPESFSFMDRLFGRNLMPEARGRVGETPFAEGMTIAEINAAALQGDYQSLVPGTFAAVASNAGIYRPIDEGIEFTTAFESRLNRLMSSQAYTLAVGNDGGDPTGPNTTRLLQERLGGLVDGYIEQYGSSFFADQEGYLRGIMGDEYVDGLATRLAPPARTEEAPPARITPEPAGGAGDETPEVQQTSAVLTEVPAIETPEVEAVVPTVEEPQVEAVTPATDEEPAQETQPNDTTDQRTEYEKLSDAGLDDLTISLLQTRGSDMLDYAIRQGATTEEELFNVLTQYGRDNRLQMPFDMAALIYAIKSAIPN